MTRWATAALAALAVSAAAAADPRPNVLFCMADDWAWPHAGVYGDRVVKTPTFDRVAREGVLFTQGPFRRRRPAPPSRGGDTDRPGPAPVGGGRQPARHPAEKFAVYPDLLEAAGYHVGLMGKGWGPGDLEAAAARATPPGRVQDFGDVPQGGAAGQAVLLLVRQPRPAPAVRERAGRRRRHEAGGREGAAVPARHAGGPRRHPATTTSPCSGSTATWARSCEQSEAAGLLDNTLVVMTGDNGMAFPRGKANLYDAGSHSRWPSAGRPG